MKVWNILLEGLTGSSTECELHAAIAALEQQLTSNNRLTESKQEHLQWIFTLLKTIFPMMSKLQDEAAIDQLLQLADSCFRQCHGYSCSDEAYVVLLYSYMKKLSGYNRTDAALGYGLQLLSLLGCFSPGNSQSTRFSSTHTDLMLGAGLNVLMCHCKLQKCIIDGLHDINAAAGAVLQVLGRGSGKTIAQHADALCSSLLQLNSLVGKEASHNSNGRDGRAPQLPQGVMLMQQHLFLAASMSSKAHVLPQLAAQASAALPDRLQYCSIAAWLLAARQHYSSSDLSVPVCSVRVEVAGMQTLLQGIVSRPSVAAACIQGLANCVCQHEQQLLGIISEVSMVLGLLCSSCSSLQLNASTLTDVRAAMECAVTSVQSHAPASAATCEAAKEKHALSDLTNKMSSMSMSAAAATKPSKRRSDSSSMHKAGHEPATAKAVPCQQQQAVFDVFQQQLAVWCLQQLVKLEPMGDNKLATLCVAFTISLISAVIALHSSRCAGVQLHSPWGTVVRAVAMVARTLMQSYGGVMSKATVNKSSATATSGEEAHTASQLLAVLPHFTVALRKLTGFGAEHQDPSNSVTDSQDCYGSELSSDELQWLSCQLYTIALDRRAATESTCSNHSQTVICSSGLAVELLLAAWQCTYAQLSGQACCTLSIGTGSSKSPETLHASATVEGHPAVITLVQQAHGLFSMLGGRAAIDKAPSGAANSNCTAEHKACNPEEQPGMHPLSGQHMHDVQHVMLHTTSSTLQHIAAITERDQEVAEQLHYHVHKLMKTYGRLRCRGAAVDSQSSSDSNTQAARSAAARSHRRSTNQSKQQQSRQEGEHSQTSLGGWQLPSVVHLLLQQQQQCDSSSGRILAGSMPVVHAAWLECKALLSTADDGRQPERVAAAAAAAVQHLLDELCSCKTGTGWIAAVLSATSQMVKGMVLSARHGLFNPDTCSPASSSSSVNSSISGTAEAMAVDALNQACQQWAGLLPLKMGSEKGSSGGAKSSTKNSNGSRGMQKVAGRSSRGGSSSCSSSNSGSPAGLDPAGLATAVACELGLDVAPGVLMLAALSHCLLGIVQARAAAQLQIGTGTVLTAAGDGNDIDGVDDNADSQFTCSTESDAGEAHVSDSTAAPTQKLWTHSFRHLDTGAQLFVAMQHATCNSANAGSLLHPCSCFATEAAMSALQAWHIAGLQGWDACQMAYGDAVAVLLPWLPAQLRTDLQHLQLLWLAESEGKPSWLGLLVAPQQLAATAASGNSSSSTGNVGGGKTPSRCGQATASTAASRSAATAAQAVVCNCTNLCACSLQEERHAIAAAKQSVPHLPLEAAASTGGAQRLLGALSLLAECQAAATLCDAAGAYTAAEQALQVCRSVLAAAGTTCRSWLLQPCSGSVVCQYGVPLYMSALWMASTVLESSGAPAEALRALKQLVKLSTASSCSCLTALAHAKIAAIHLKSGDDDSAAASAAAAAQCATQFRQHHQDQQGIVCAYVTAAVLQAQAGCSGASLQHVEAQYQLTDAIKALHDAVAATMVQQPQQHQQLRGVSLLSWLAVDLQAKLQLQLAHCLLATQGRMAAVQQLNSALADLTALAACSRCNDSAWPAARAALQLQQLAWCFPDLPANQSNGQALQLIGLGSSSSHQNLQAEFACAAAEAGSSSLCNTDTAAADCLGHSSSSKPARARCRGTKERPTKQSGSSTSDQATSSMTGPGGRRTYGSKASQDRQLPEATAVDSVAWLSQLLLLLPACAQCPTLLLDACSMLRSVLQAHGVFQGAVLVLQLSLGASITQQQLMKAATRLSQPCLQDLQAAAGTTGTAEQTPECSGTQDMCKLWQQIQTQLDLQLLLADLAAIAKHTGTQCNSKGVAESMSTSQLLSDLFSQVDSIASEWLQKQVSGLLPGTAMCSIAAAAQPSPPTAVGTMAADGCWCPLVAPAVASGAVPIHSAAGAASESLAAGCAGTGVLICRMLAEAPTGRGQKRSPALPLLVQLHASIQQGDGCQFGTLEVLHELSDILGESSSNMQQSLDCSSTAHKAKWWKQRVALDARMGALLQQVDEQLLGPWRCLLMQPGKQQVEAAAAAAAATFVASYFEFVFEERPRQLLTQLVAVLLVHLDAVSCSERHQAVRDLCQLTQQRVDGLHLSSLLSGLEEAHAAVAAAAAAVPGALAQAGMHHTHPTSPAQKANPSRDDDCSSAEAAVAAADASAGVPDENHPAAAAAFVTPAAPRARSRLGALQQASLSAKAPRSRLKAMQKNSSQGLSCGGVGVTEAATSGLLGKLSEMLLSDADEEQAGLDDLGAPAVAAAAAGAADTSGHTEICHVEAAAGKPSANASAQQRQQPKRSTRAASTTRRRVRFTAAAIEGAANEDDSLYESVPVPASIARHAAPRSRLQLQGTHMAQAEGAAAGGSCSNATSLLSAESAGHACASDGGADKLCALPRARLSVLAVADHEGPEQQQQLHGCWMPSVLLLLDSQLQQLPWESLPGLQQQSMYRCPSISFAVAAVTRYLATHNTQGSKAHSGSSSNPQRTGTRQQQQQQQALCQLRLRDGFYLLNPDGDLQATQETFEGWLQQLGLQGVSGSRPVPAHLKSRLQAHQLFLYFGHGAGEQYVPLTALKQLDRCAASLLMGCSSGRLKQLGLYEPSGAMWGYLLAGCPTAIGNLWDVTDRDIDRFAQAVLQQWAGSNSSSTDLTDTSSSATRHRKASQTSTSRHGGPRALRNSSTQPDQAQSGEAISTAGDSTVQRAAAVAEPLDVCLAVAVGRQACRLPKLIGAAAVCYGLPAYIVQSGT